MLAESLVVLLLPFILWAVYWYYKVQYFESYLSKINGPKGLPLVGNALDLSSSTELLPKLMEYYNTYKTNFKIYIGHQAYLYITEPKDFEFFMSSTSILTKSDLYAFSRRWVGTGLLTSTETAMGTAVNAQEDCDSEYVKCSNELLRIIIKRAFSPVLSNELLYFFSEMYRKEKRTLEVIHNHTRSVISSRKNEFLNSLDKNGVSVDSLGRKKKKAFLDLLIEYSAKDPSFTDEDIREEVDTFMFEGHDTTATSIMFALECLARHQEVQKNVYEELQTIFSDDTKRRATYGDLQEMKYLEMVIKESIRYYTTTPFIGRMLEKDTEWNGIILPKGLMIHMFIYGLHHSTNSHKAPEVFNPERFNSENTKDKNPFANVPFSAGPRNCIGQKFALLEMKSVISNVLRNFELLPPVPDHKIILKSEGVLKSDNGVYIRLKSR